MRDKDKDSSTKPEDYWKDIRGPGTAAPILYRSRENTEPKFALSTGRAKRNGECSGDGVAEGGPEG
jgi:hypothetical protein